MEGLEHHISIIDVLCFRIQMATIVEESTKSARVHELPSHFSMAAACNFNYDGCCHHLRGKCSEVQIFQNQKKK